MRANHERMTQNACRAGFLLLVLGSALFVLLGFRYERLVQPWGLADFKEIYYAARLAVHHGDPYQPSQLLAYWQQETGSLAAASSMELRQVVSLLTNLPTSLFLIAPIAVLPWNVAQSLWMAVTAAAFVLASFLIWRLAAPCAPRLSALLIFLLLVDNVGLIMIGNLLGVVVSLAAIATWCFLRERFAWAGVLCLGIALTFKPHDVGFVWLYLLLASGALRKRALQSAAVAAAIGILALVWMHNISPHWNQELHSNLRAAMVHGGRDDPGPAGGSSESIICLQAVLSLVRDDPHFYNPASYFISGALILLWALVTWRARFSRRMACFALAAIAPLSMLPVYHRSEDATLLLLAVPACAILWNERQPVRWAALALSCGTMLTMGGFLLERLFRILRFTPGPGYRRALEAVHPISLLILGVFFLWIYFQQTVAREADSEPSSPAPEPRLAQI